MNENPKQIERPPASQTSVWALREPETPRQRQSIDTYLSDVNVPEVVRFPSYHDDRLNAQAMAGRFERVLFADLDALLAGVWKGYLHLDEWFEAGVHIEIIDSPMPPDQLRKFLADTYESYMRYQHMHRRRQILAAIVLGVLTLVAMASMIWLIPPMR